MYFKYMKWRKSVLLMSAKRIGIKSATVNMNA